MVIVLCCLPYAHQRKEGGHKYSFFPEIWEKGMKMNEKKEIYKILMIVGGGVQLGPLATAATNGLFCQPRVIMMMEKLVE
jgi:hypothetical protein